ncbi:jg3625 [Pararge aegeria aegeria]|uniref:Jg3625 protein n=1 Tax=Pararge aegeria aegeria TaxID=348720 RepID=A0A8S4R994_9NEOP|nr:jg3625 [Pararge aegeria aegeria]
MHVKLQCHFKTIANSRSILPTELKERTGVGERNVLREYITEDLVDLQSQQPYAACFQRHPVTPLMASIYIVWGRLTLRPSFTGAGTLEP